MTTPCQEAVDSQPVRARLAELVSRARAEFTQLGFNPLDDVGVRLESMTDAKGPYAHVLQARCTFEANDEGQAFELRGRVLFLDPAGRGFVHVEMSRVGATAQLLPAKEVLHLQMELAKMPPWGGARTCAAEPERDLRAHLLEQLERAQLQFDALPFRQQAQDLLAP